MEDVLLLGALPLALGVGAGAVYLLVIAPARDPGRASVAGSGEATSRPASDASSAATGSPSRVDPAAATLAAAVKLAIKEPLPREPLCERNALVEEVQRFFDAMSAGPAAQRDPAAVVRATFDRAGFDAEVRAVGRSADAVLAAARSDTLAKWPEALAVQAVKETEVTRRRVRAGWRRTRATGGAGRRSSG